MATVRHWIQDTVIQYILMAAGNIAVMGKLKNGMYLKYSDGLLQILDEWNHERHRDVLLIHVWRVRNGKGHQDC